MGYAIQLAIIYFLTPYVLQQIGDTRYGIWVIVVSITGYYGLLDLGLRAGLTQYITRYFAAGDWSRMNSAASSGLALQWCCAVCVLLFTFASAAFAENLFAFPSGLALEARWCILVVGCSTSIQFLLFPFSVALTAAQRFDIVTATSLISRISSAVATVGCLTAGFGLIGLCVAGALGNVLDYLLRWGIGSRIVPELKFSLKFVNWQSCRECLGFGLWSALLAASALLISFSDALVIGLFMPVSAVVFFALANNVIRYVAHLFVPFNQVFFPAATALDARNDVAGLQRLYLTGSRLLTLLVLSVALIATVWADDFYSTWVGAKYLDDSLYHSVPLLFRILLIGTVCAAMQGIGSKVLLGRRKIGGLAKLFICEGFLNLTISLLLIHQYGLLGVALGTMLPAIVFQGILHPIMVCRELGLSFSVYSRNILWPAIRVGVVLAPLLIFVHHFTTSPGPLVLLLVGVGSTLLAAIVISVLGLTMSDRQRYVYPLILRSLESSRFASETKL